MQTVKIDRLDLEPGDRVLDLGCGSGRHLREVYRSNEVQVVGLDIDRDCLREAVDRMTDSPESSGRTGWWAVQQGDALGLPFPGDTFDAVICSEVLEHLDDYRTVLEEIGRVLRDGGQLAVSVPRYGPEAVCWFLSEDYHRTEGGHVRIFKQDELLSDIEDSGFVCRNRHYAHPLHSPFWWLKCLLWDRKEQSRLVNAYQRFLEWDLMNNPAILQWLKALLNPLIGKSLVLYFTKEPNQL